MAKTDDETFTPATGKFATYADGKPVVGWVTAATAVERNELTAAIQRAVVITESDRILLKQIRDVIDAEPEDAAAHLALLDRLIGNRR